MIQENKEKSSKKSVAIEHNERTDVTARIKIDELNSRLIDTQDSLTKAEETNETQNQKIEDLSRRIGQLNEFEKKAGQLSDLVDEYKQCKPAAEKARKLEPAMEKLKKKLVDVETEYRVSCSFYIQL